MNYIVVRPFQKSLCTIQIVSGDDTRIKLPFESWALRTGPQVLFAHTKMHRILKNGYLMGSYEVGAQYAFTYDEMCAIMTKYIGPSDRERYLSLKHKPAQYEYDRWSDATYIGLRTVGLVGHLAWKAVTTVVFVAIVPLIAMFIGPKK